MGDLNKNNYLVYTIIYTEFRKASQFTTLDSRTRQRGREIGNKEEMHVMYQATVEVPKPGRMLIYEPPREKTHLLISAPNEDSNQPAHPCSLTRVFDIRLKKLCILVYPNCAQWRCWSDCANAQADLNLRWAHRSEGTFSDVAAHMCSLFVY